jgi:hypothetical protein
MVMRVSGVATALFGAAMLSRTKLPSDTIAVAANDEYAGSSEIWVLVSCVFPRRVTIEGKEGK